MVRMLLPIIFLPPSSLVFIVFVASLLSCVSSMQLSTVDSKLCATLCQCTANTVDCNHQDRLSFIPSKIISDYDQLHISHASFEYGGLTQDNFSTITHLKSLKIVYSMLDSVSDNTFQLMTVLRYLDLSHNRFSILASSAFNGLRLTNLYLEQNQGGLQITPDMFQGLTVTNLHIRSNNISHISVKPFERLQIAKLYLFNNSLTTIDRQFENIFSYTDKLLDVTKNPLHCSCGLSWFPDLIDKWREVPSFVQIRCHTPISLRDSLVASLSSDKFACETPSINKISIDLSQNFLKLVCHARGSIPPRMSWTQLSPETGGEIPNVSKMTTINDNSFVTVNISKLMTDNSFICRTWNEINSSNQVLVKLKIAEDFFGKLRTPIDSSIGNEDRFKSQLPRNANPLPETHFLFTKQFSILQMIGAVVGTFTSVIVLIFVICCSQEHIMKKTSNSNTYWTTIPPDLKNPYNRVVAKSPILPTMAMMTSSNSQDYDIPHESNNFLQSYYTERGAPHYTEGTPANYFSTAT